MSVISTLVVELRAEAENFSNGIKAAAKEASEFEKTMKPVINLAKDLGTAMVAAGGVASGAIAVLVKQAADYGDSMRDAAIRTGVTVQSLAGLKLAAEQSGASFDDLQTGLKKLAVNADAATKSGSEQEKMFSQMGITVKDVHTGAMRPMSDILLDVAEHFKNQGDKTLEAGEAVKLFGKNGVQLIEFLELGKTGLQEFQDHAQKLGLVIGNDVANQADRFNDSMNDLKNAELGASIVIGNELLPKATQFAVWLTNTIVSVREFVQEHRGLIDVVTVAAGVIGAVGTALVSMVYILPTAKALWVALDVAMDANPIGLVVVAIGALVTGLIYFRQEIVGYTLAAIAKWLEGVEKFLDICQTAADAIGLDGLSGKIGTARDYLNHMTSDMEAGSKVILDGAKAADTHANATEKLSGKIATLPAPINDTSEAIKAQNEALKLAWEGYNKFNDAVNKGVESTFAAASAAPVLNQQLANLENTGTSISTILKYFGDQAINTKDQLTELGLPIPERIKDIATLAEIMKQGAVSTDDLNKALKVTQGIKFDGPLIPIPPPTDVLVAPVDVFNSTARKAVDTIADMQTQANLTEVAIQQLAGQGYSASQISVMLSGSINSAADSSKKFGTQLGEATQAQIAFNQQMAESQRWSDQWARNFASVTSGITDALADVIFRGKSFGDEFANLGKSLAESFFKTFTNELLSPMTSAMSELGRTMARELNSVLLGNTATGGNDQGLLGGVVSSIGGLFGGGSNASDAFKALPEGVEGPSLAGTGGGSGGGSGTSLGSTFLDLGIGAAVGVGLNLAVDWYKNLPHFKQNELVHEFQFPFDQAFSNIINSVDAASRAGTLTLSDAQKADDDMHTMWFATSQAADRWAAGDGNKTKAITGFHQTEDKFVQGWLDWIDTITVGLGGHPGSVYAFAQGTPYVPYDQLALIHKGEMITPAAQNPNNPASSAWGGGGSTDNSITVHINIEPGATVTREMLHEINSELMKIFNSDGHVDGQRDGMKTTITRGVLKQAGAAGLVR